MQHTSPLYWNMLSFSFTIIEFSLAISFRMVMQRISPLEKGRKRRDYLCRTDVKNYKRWTHKVVRPSLFCYTIPKEKVKG